MCSRSSRRTVRPRTRTSGLGVTRAAVAPFLETGFPWHDWQTAHEHLRDPDDWWQPVLELVADAMVGVGIDQTLAASLSTKVRSSFIDPARWHVYPDSFEALRLSASEGWRNLIVSNHVPELPCLIDGLGLSDHVEAVVNSAHTGSEKPHPGAFRLALEAAEDPATAWMVGDNPIADIAGAAQLGIPGILTRSPQFDPGFVHRLETRYGSPGFSDWQIHCERRADTALEAVEMILKDRR